MEYKQDENLIILRQNYPNIGRDIEIDFSHGNDLTIYLVEEPTKEYVKQLVGDLYDRYKELGKLTIRYSDKLIEVE